MWIIKKTSFCFHFQDNLNACQKKLKKRQKVEKISPIQHSAVYHTIYLVHNYLTIFHVVFKKLFLLFQVVFQF